MIQRLQFRNIKNDFFKGKAILIFGPRQTGKTTLLQYIIKTIKEPSIYLNCDEPDVRQRLQNMTSSALKKLIGNARFMFIDEAQRVLDIGLTLKLIVDQIPGVQIIATGSSAFELSNKINEPLTGRKFEYRLLPIATEEMISFTNVVEEERLLSHRLIYGMYPDVINNQGNEQKILANLAGSYLYKDIFAFQDLRKPEVLEKLLQALALQTASLVSYHELAHIVGMDVKSVMRYIELLEKTFVIFRLHSFSRNIRNELKKSRKIYFYDNGIRNAIISNFSVPDLRSDTGALWENFIISERIKWLANNNKFINQYFWRTKQQQEIDYIEEYGGKLYGYEFKWNPRQKARFPKTFLDAYPGSKTMTISKDNYIDFLTND